MEADNREINAAEIAGNQLARICFGASNAAGWWDGQDKESIWTIGTKLILVVTEIGEAFEGARKGLMDDHLPHRTMLEVELADVVIRVADLAGALGLDLGGAIAEKLAYNAQRADHKKEAREGAFGKKV